MALKRALMVCELDGSFNNDQQRQFLEDIESIIDGDEIGGYTVAGENWVWIDFEGPEGHVEASLEEIAEREDVADYEVENQETHESRELRTAWRGFDDESAALTYDF